MGGFRSTRLVSHLRAQPYLNPRKTNGMQDVKKKGGAAQRRLALKPHLRPKKISAPPDAAWRRPRCLPGAENDRRVSFKVRYDKQHTFVTIRHKTPGFPKLGNMCAN